MVKKEKGGKKPPNLNLHPGCLGTQDTCYVGTLKGVGRIYQRIFINTYTKIAFVKLYDRKNAADREV